MSLSTENLGGSGDSAGTEIAKGVYATVGQIIGIQDLSGMEHPNIKKTFDLCIEIKVKKEGVGFTPVYTFLGNFKKENGKVTDWGGAFVVGNLFKAFGINESLGNDYKIPMAWKKKILNKTLVVVDYVSGTYTKDGVEKTSYSNWNIVGSLVEQDEEKAVEGLKVLWEKNRAKGYPKNYDPSPLKGGSGVSSGSGMLSTGGSGHADADGIALDDDGDDSLPF